MRTQAKAFDRGALMPHKTLTFVPADQNIRPLRDVIIVEPQEHTLSALLITVSERRPVRGIVKAVGPGCYPKRYDHSEKHRRTKTWDSKRLRPTQVKVGDVVELGAIDGQGYAFETFLWGETLHLIAREEDVAGVREAA